MLHAPDGKWAKGERSAIVTSGNDSPSGKSLSLAAFVVGSSSSSSDLGRVVGVVPAWPLVAT
jgi:hypothetical protein